MARVTPPAGLEEINQPRFPCAGPKRRRCGVTPLLPRTQAAEWGPKIDSIVAWFGNLQAVNIEGVPPALRACEDGNRLR